MRYIDHIFKIHRKEKKKNDNDIGEPAGKLQNPGR
jgi:hypothetical protein